jgi:hypothetical protein
VRALHAAAIGAALLGCLALGAGAFWLLHPLDLPERLVEDAGALSGGRGQRPLHVPEAEPGTLADGLALHLPPFEAAYRETTEAERSALREVLAGTRPAGQVPPRLRTQLLSLESHLSGVLRATRTASPALAGSEDGRQPCPAATWRAFDHAVRLAALRARSALDTGRAEEALRDTLDGVALGLEATSGDAVMGRVFAGAAFSAHSAVLAETLATLNARARSDAVERVRAVRDAVPAFAVTVRRDLLEAKLLAVGSDLSTTQLTRLPPRLQALARSARAPRPDESSVLQRAMCRLADRRLPALLAALALSGAARDEALRATERSWSPLRVADRYLVDPFMVRPTEWGMHASLAETSLLRLDLAVMAAAATTWREDRGAWPTAVAELVGAGLLTRAEGERLAEARVEPGPGGAFLLALPLPRSTPDWPEEATVTLRR